MRPHGTRCSSAARYFIITVCALVSFAQSASAFPLIVQSGDTLASIAQRVYGRPDFERLLVSANGLEARGAAIVPGMQLEVPALAYRRIIAGDTWAALAERWLGAPHRAAVLAFANEGQPWVPPPENAEIVIPYNLRFIAEGGETLEEVAIRFLGSKKRTWMLQQYNGLERPVLQRGQVVLLPITALPLTAAGQEAAKRAFEAWGSGGVVRAAQRSAANELPVLLADVRGGRYAEAITRGVALLATATLTTPQRAAVHRQLLEAYVALGATGKATQACRDWLAADGRARLDPLASSPKVIAACTPAPAAPP